MPKFFEDRSSIKGSIITVAGDNFNHLTRVLRARIGDEITISCDGCDYHCVIDEVLTDRLTARIEDFSKNETEPEVDIYLFQSLPKLDKMDEIIQKCVEIGAHKIIPVRSERCVVKVEEGRAEKKLTRWRKISEAAAKQCGRGIIPEVGEVISFSEAVVIAREMDLALIPYEQEKSKTLNGIDLSGKKTIAVFIGPEGGFSDEEISLCVQNSVTPITLGRRILRTETAGIVTLANLLYIIENTK